MTSGRLRLFGYGFGLLLCSACSNDDKGKGESGVTDSGSGSDADTAADDCPVIVKEADCDKTQLPIVFVHGTYAEGDTFGHVATLLGSNGFCQSRIFGVEYNSLGESPGDDCAATNPTLGCGKIDAAIDKILADTGASQVVLAGHSQGTKHCGIYIGLHPEKVAHYLNFSGRPDVGDMDTLSLSSLRDLNLPSAPPPHHATGSNVKQVTFTDEDHFAVADSLNAFKEVYKFLKNGEEPKYDTVQCGESPVTIEGIAESFADNVPRTGKLEIRKVTDTPRPTDPPVLTIQGDADGHFGPIQLERNVAYEFKGFADDGSLLGYQYFTPFKRDNRLVRMLTPPDNAGIRALTTDHLVRVDGSMDLIVRWAAGGFRKDLGASLKVDDEEILTDENAGAATESNANLQGGVAALFACDADGNGQTSLGLLYDAPFLSFTDLYIPTKDPKLVRIEFTAGSEEPLLHHSVRMSNWPSTDAQVLVYLQ